ncbi:MAG: VacJ family lipoprotein [Paracoccaceae bacterium]|jgi:phospholipid-binding lipoprotein MlaA|nr:VacJ family lipoprotein [Paracoccaceae bacterium]
MIKKYDRTLCALILSLMAAIGLPGCASLSVPAIEASDDPYESVNRKVHGFNKALDKNLVRPLSTGYTAVVPPEVQVLVSNFSDNLSLPASVVNELLQGDITHAASNATRFAVNSTLGLAGLFDPSVVFGVPAQKTDFGETLHVWNAPPGDYLELPVLGPSTERAALGLLVDIFTNPLGYQLKSEHRVYRNGAKAASTLSLRSQYGSTIDAMYYDSADSYTQSRLVYLQNRKFTLGGTDEIEYTESYFDPYGDDYAE